MSKSLTSSDRVLNGFIAIFFLPLAVVVCVVAAPFWALSYLLENGE